MKFNINNETLTFFFEGRIDSVNAPEVEKEVMSILEEYKDKHNSVIINMKNIEYISSAGLRVILKIRKSETNLKVVDVNNEVYDILQMTGFTEMFEVEKAYREFSVEGCEELGRGSNGIVYRYNPEIVIKVYRNPDALDDIKHEREVARKALIMGIPTAIPFDVVKVGDKYASVFELLNATSFSKMIKNDPNNIDKCVPMFVDLLKQIHSTEVKKGELPDMKDKALDWAKYLKGIIPDDQEDKLISLIENTPDRNTMIHGDYHTNNVELQNGEVLLIDMDTLAIGHPVFELGSMYLGFVAFGELDPTITEKFMKFSADTAKVVWRKSLALYLNTEDENRINEVEKKAQVIAYTRLLRRTIRREKDTEHGQKQIALCKEYLTKLLSEIDTLNF